jgi:hypothetical protein
MDDLQQCELCFQPVGPFYRVRILPATSLDFCGGTVTPPHTRTAGEHKIACHTCRYTFTNLEPVLVANLEACSSEEPAEPCSNLEPCSTEESVNYTEDEPPVAPSIIPAPTPTLTGSTARPSRSRIRFIANNRAATSRDPVGEQAGQRAPPRIPDTTLLSCSRAPPFGWLS